MAAEANPLPGAEASLLQTEQYFGSVSSPTPDDAQAGARYHGVSLLGRRSRIAACHGDKPVEHEPVTDAQAVMVVLARHPRAQAANGRGGLQRELTRNVHVVE